VGSTVGVSRHPSSLMTRSGVRGAASMLVAVLPMLDCPRNFLFFSSLLRKKSTDRGFFAHPPLVTFCHVVVFSYHIEPAEYSLPDPTMFQGFARFARQSRRLGRNIRAFSKAADNKSRGVGAVPVLIAAGAGGYLLWNQRNALDSMPVLSPTISVADGEKSHRWPNTTVLDSPAITLLFTSIRNLNTPVAQYITDADRLMRILAEEGLARVKGVEVHTVTTPCGKYTGLKPPNQKDMCAVSIVRSGDILLEAVRSCAPNIKVGKILCQRDEEHPDKIAKLYYSKFPKDIASLSMVILVDPMLATGGSAILAIKTLIEAGVKEENILFLNVVSCPEGLDALSATYPKIKIVTAAVDSHLNENKYIVPGLGDFGDRYYST